MPSNSLSYIDHSIGPIRQHWRHPMHRRDHRQGKTTIEVFDYLGQLIDRFEVQSVLNGLTIPYSLSGKAAGVYVISITNGYDHYKEKVVKYYAAPNGMIHY